MLYILMIGSEKIYRAPPGKQRCHQKLMFVMNDLSENFDYQVADEHALSNTDGSHG